MCSSTQEEGEKEEASLNQTPLRQRQLKHQSTGIAWVPKICHSLPAATFCEGPGPPEVPVPCLDDMQRSLLELVLDSFLSNQTCHEASWKGKWGVKQRRQASGHQVSPYRLET